MHTTKCKVQKQAKTCFCRSVNTFDKNVLNLVFLLHWSLMFVILTFVFMLLFFSLASLSHEIMWFRIIIKNLLLGYFHTPPSKRHEALQVIGQVLSYSRDEMKEVWVSSLVIVIITIIVIGIGRIICRHSHRSVTPLRIAVGFRLPVQFLILMLRNTL